MVWIHVIQLFESGEHGVDGDAISRGSIRLKHLVWAAAVDGANAYIDQCAFEFGQFEKLIIRAANGSDFKAICELSRDKNKFGFTIFEYVIRASFGIRERSIKRGLGELACGNRFGGLLSIYMEYLGKQVSETVEKHSCSVSQVGMTL
jgi:hypothetical protein